MEIGRVVKLTPSSVKTNVHKNFKIILYKYASTQDPILKSQNT